MTTSADIREALRIRYPKPEWAIFFEVANATGGGKVRYADAVAMNLFPSRGLALHGFEIKVSRSDWLNELKQPTKSEPVQKYCDFWWIVTPKDIVKADELPPTWGLMEYKGSKLFSVRPAPKLAAEPMTRAFAACMIRRAGELDEGQRQAALAHEKDLLQRQFDEHLERSKRDYGHNWLELKKQVDAFQAASGIDINHYGGERVGEAVKDLFLGWNKLPQRLERMRVDLAGATKQVSAALAELQPVPADAVTA